MISLGPLFFVSSEEKIQSASLKIVSGGNNSLGAPPNFPGANSEAINGLVSAPKKSGLRKMENSTDYECVLFQTPSYVILSSLGSFYMPLFLMICLYTGVFLKIRQQSKIKFRKKVNYLIYIHL